MSAITEAPTRGKFDPYNVPSKHNGTLPWPQGITPAGWDKPPDSALVTTLSNLLDDRLREAGSLHPKPVTVKLFKPLRLEDDSYILVDRPSATAIPTVQPVRQGKFSALKITGSEILAEAFLGRDCFTDARDEQLWDSMLSACKEVKASGHELRKIADLTAALVLLRAGIVNFTPRWE